MGSCLTKNELSKLSTAQVIDFLFKLEEGLYSKYAKTVHENKVTGIALVSLLDEQDVELFLLDMGVYKLKERKKLFRVMRDFVEHDGSCSMVTLDSEAVELLPSTAAEEVRRSKEEGGGEGCGGVVSALQLKAKGYSAVELLQGGLFPLHQVLACDYSPEEMLAAGYVTDLRMSSLIGGEDSHISGVYKGMCVDGKAEGEGTCHYSNGDVYEGCWKEGLRSGEGRESRKNGDVYQGTWLWGKKHGKGVHTLCADAPADAGGKEKKIILGKDESRGTYIGDFQLDKWHGRGRFVASSGYVSLLLHKVCMLLYAP